MEQAQTQDAPQPEGAPTKIKAMRRQACPCGSGKVFKNCHEGDPGYEVATDPSEAVAPPPPSAKAGQKGPGPKGFPQQAQRFNSGPSRNTGAPHRRKV